MYAYEVLIPLFLLYVMPRGIQHPANVSAIRILHYAGKHGSQIPVSQQHRRRINILNRQIQILSQSARCPFAAGVADVPQALRKILFSEVLIFGGMVLNNFSAALSEIYETMLMQALPYRGKK